MAKGRFKDRKVDTAVNAVNLAERVGHWRHVTALSVSVKCADIPGRVGDVLHQGLGTPAQDKSSPARNGRTQSGKRQRFRPTLRILLCLFSGRVTIRSLPQEGREGAPRADLAAEPLPGFLSTKSPVQTLKGV